MRDRSIDLGRGLAILAVYLGHSVLYHPIKMESMYPWCHILVLVISTFQMPLFFILSGYLLANSKKAIGELYKSKFLRLIVPYITAMAIIIGVKMFLPAEMSFNKAAMGGGKSMIINALFYGGDLWFVYTLFIIFLLLIPIRKWLKNRWLVLGLIILLITTWLYVDIPTVFTLDKVVRYMVFFISGFALNKYYSKIKVFALHYWWLVYIIAILTNGVFALYFSSFVLVYRFVLPFIGSLAIMTLAFQLEKIIDCSKIAQYIEYCGKYSLQFYLFPFGYPIIRILLVSILHVSNPYLIVSSVFLFQLITSTIIVEITRRIKWLKIPFGY